jgi:very-short-patch-repair endonuclease
MRSANLVKTRRAKRLRQQSTDAERKLRNRLRSRANYGFKFLRHETIGPYVVDFLCRERLRFWNNNVISNIECVSETIAKVLPVESPPHPDR